MTPAALVLEPAGWSPRNWQALNQLLATVGHRSADYQPDRQPYAVFDWDNTCIMNDTEETLLLYQAENLLFKMTPPEFARALRQGVPAVALHPACTNVAGLAVNLEDLLADLDEAYQWLHAHYQGLAGSMPLAQVQDTGHYQNFRAKLYYLYGALCDSFPMEVGYKWIIYLYQGFSTAGLQAMVQASIEHNLAEPLRQEIVQSSDAQPGRTGVLAATHFFGLRIHTEMRALMHGLRANGIDVYVSTASLDDVVRVFACQARYGYDLPVDNVLGLQLEMRDGCYTGTYKAGWHFNWGPGKTTGIQNVFVARKGYGPVLVCGDSDGDAWMMRDFSDTHIGLAINRLHAGAIGENCQKAAASLGQLQARFLLQGRDEHTGAFSADEKTLKYGHTEPRLLA